MTPKEAFRYQCWIFHGIKPSKTKQDKRAKKEHLLEKGNIINPQESYLMKELEKVQEKTGKPFMVLGTKRIYDQ